jgi:hypothetical protein
MPSLLGRRIPTSAIIASAPRAPQAASSAPLAPAAGSSGIGEAIASLGRTFQNGAQIALRQEQLQKLANENELTRMVAGAIGADGIINNPQVASIAASLGAMDPQRYGRLQAIQAATTGGVDSPKAAEFLTGLGEYRATPLYASRDFANQQQMQQMQEQTKLRMAEAQEQTKLRIADNTLETVMTPEGPKFVRRSAAVGQAPVLTTDQTKAVVQSQLLPTLPENRKADFAFGAQSPGELGNVTVGGRTLPAFARADGFYAPGGGKIEGDVTSFGKLTAAKADDLSGDSGVGKDVLTGRINTERAVGLIDNLTEELTKPNAGVSVGFLGSLSQTANNIRSQFEAGARALGQMGAKDELRAPEVATALDNVMRENSVMFAALQRQGIDTAQVRALIEDLAYAQAKANDPNGRVSNQDVERAGRQVGMGLGDPVAMRAVLSDLRERTISGQEIRERNASAFLPRGQTLPAWNAPFMQGRQRPAQGAAPAQGTTPASNLKQKYGLE